LVDDWSLDVDVKANQIVEFRVIRVDVRARGRQRLRRRVVRLRGDRSVHIKRRVYVLVVRVRREVVRRRGGPGGGRRAHGIARPHFGRRRRVSGGAEERVLRG
jgi:hypothetical protein